MANLFVKFRDDAMIVSDVMNGVSIYLKKNIGSLIY